MGPIINLSTLFPWRILSLFAYSFTGYNIAHSCTKDKKHPLLTFSTIFAVRILTSVLIFHCTKFNAFGYPIFSLLYFLILCLLTDGSILSKILCSILQVFSSFVSTLVLGLIDPIIYQNKDYAEVFGTDEPNLYHLSVYLLYCLIIMITGFIFSGIIKLINANKTPSRLKSRLLFAYFSFFPISHMFIIIFALYLGPVTYENTSNSNFVTDYIVAIITGAVLVFDCFYPFIIDKFEKLSLENEQQAKLLLKNEMEYQQTKMLSDEKNEFRKLKHDFSNLLTTTQGFLEIGKPDKALNIIKKTQKDISEISGIPLCSNETVNIIFYIKEHYATSLGVKLEIEVNETALLNIEDYSICRIMHNMLDNAINACAQTERKYAKFLVSIDPDKFTVDCENSFVKGKKKKERQLDHGHGINIIKDIVKPYGGSYTSKIENDLFYTKVEMQNISL